MSIPITITKRKSGYTAAFALPWGQRVRMLSYASRQEARTAAKKEITRRLSHSLS